MVLWFDAYPACSGFRVLADGAPCRITVEYTRKDLSTNLFIKVCVLCFGFVFVLQEQKRQAPIVKVYP